jgi:hypothetical protein
VEGVKNLSPKCETHQPSAEALGTRHQFMSESNPARHIGLDLALSAATLKGSPLQCRALRCYWLRSVCGIAEQRRARPGAEQHCLVQILREQGTLRCFHQKREWRALIEDGGHGPVEQCVLLLRQRLGQITTVIVVTIIVNDGVLVGKEFPGTAEYMDGYAAAKDNTSREFAAVFAMLQAPGMAPYITLRRTPLEK